MQRFTPVPWGSGLLGLAAGSVATPSVTGNLGNHQRFDHEALATQQPRLSAESFLPWTLLKISKTVWSSTHYRWEMLLPKPDKSTKCCVSSLVEGSTRRSKLSVPIEATSKHGPQYWTSESSPRCQTPELNGVYSHHLPRICLIKASRVLSTSCPAGLLYIMSSV